MLSLMVTNYLHGFREVRELSQAFAAKARDVE
jgi:hypothetical protein